MTNSIADIIDADVLLVIGSNTTESHPVLSLEMKRAVMERGAKLILLDPRRIELAAFAALHLRHRPGTDAALINAMGHVIIQEGYANQEFIDARTEDYEALAASLKSWTPERAAEICEIPPEGIVEAARLYGQAVRAATFWAMGITQHTNGTDNVLALSNLALLCGQVGRPGTGLNPLRGQNNVQGACDMGGLPNVFPGYQPVGDEAARQRFAAGWDLPQGSLNPRPGLTVTEIMDGALEGKIRALYIMGENPMLSDPNISHVESALSSLDLLVCQDIFLNETGRMADVVLPGVSFAEKDGTFTNTERRVHLVRKALDPPGESRQDWQILMAVAARLGTTWSYESPSEIMEEIAGLTPQYGGIRHERLQQGGLQWPCPDLTHPGTPILHSDAFTRGRGRFVPVDWRPPPEQPDTEYPFLLSTGRVLYHWHGGTLSRRSPGLDALAPEAEVEIHPQDARQLSVDSGQRVIVRSRRGAVVARARKTRRSPPGTVFMTFHYAEAAANLLTGDEVDPVAKIPGYKVTAVRIELVDEPTEPPAGRKP